MPQKKNRSSWLKSVSTLSIFGLFAVGLASMHSEAQEGHTGALLFDEASLVALQNLNQEYGMQLNHLLDDAAAPPLLNELHQANVLGMDETATHPGLVVSLEDEYLGTKFLLLESVEARSEEELSGIAEHYTEVVPEFEHVEIDQTVELFGEAIYDWNLELSAIETFFVRPITVGVIDSGVDREHPVFEHHNFLDGWNTIEDNRDPFDDVGHGTHIAGIIASEVPGVVIAPYKIVDSSGGRLSNVLEAFGQALADDVDVINASFGVGSPSYALEALVLEAFERDIVVVAAAGNSNSSSGFYPATYSQSIAVASVDREGDKMPRSNWGEWVDVAANGQYVRSALPDASYGVKSGTSQSTAYVTAAVAEVMIGAGLENQLSISEVFDSMVNGLERIEEGALAGIPIVE